MTRSSTSIGWPSRPSSYRASGRAHYTDKRGPVPARSAAKRRFPSLQALRALLVLVAAVVVALASGLVGTKARPVTSATTTATQSSLSALSCTFVARSPAGAYSFSARKWQSVPPAPEAGLEAVEADADDVDATARELVRHAHGDGHSLLVVSSRARSAGRVHRAEETRMVCRFAAESCPPRGPPAA